MNILPKKRWHVRTKENIARVRKDEAEAAEKEKQEKLRIETANREARLKVLKQKSRDKLVQSGIKQSELTIGKEKGEHVNLFEDFEKSINTTNKEHDKEQKINQEEYEKKIGYLTYLGQDTNEALGKKNWYEVSPSSRFLQSNTIKDTYEKLVLKDADGKPKTKQIDEKDGEIAWRAKQNLDPIKLFKKYCHQINSKESTKTEPEKLKDHKNKHKDKINKKESKEDKVAKLKKLREARLKREQQEKYKTEMFLSNLNGASSSTSSNKNENKFIPKYNSQFNPELARQNYK